MIHDREDIRGGAGEGILYVRRGDRVGLEWWGALTRKINVDVVNW